MWSGFRLVLLCAALVPAFGLYEEEAGKYDWHLAMFRDVEDVEWSGNGRRVFYGAGKGVVGSLSVKSGSIIWRRMVNGDVHSMLKTSAGIIVCSDSNLVTLFGDDGSLLWEQQFSASETVLGVVRHPESSKPHIIIRTDKTITSLPLAIESPSSIYLVRSEQTAALPLTSDYTTAVVKGSSIYLINYSTNQVHTGNLFSDKSLKAVPLQKGEKLQGMSGKYITVKAGSQCRKISDGKIETSACAAGERYFEGEEGKLVRVTKTGDTALVDSEGVIVWKRNDGLAYVNDAQALEEHPEAESEIDSGTFVESYKSLLVNQLAGIQNLLEVLPATIARVSAVMHGEKVSSPPVTTNRFGLKKNLLLTTKTSIYFMNSASGSILWERDIEFFDSEDAEIVKVYKSKSKENHQVVLMVWTTSNGRDTLTAIDELGDVLTDIKSDTYKGLQVGTVVEDYLFNHNDAHYSSAVFLVKDSNKYVTYPKENVLKPKPLFYHTLDHKSGTVEGHRLQEDGSTFAHWKVSLVTDPSEEIVATSMTTFDPHQYIVTDSIKIHGNKTSGKNELLIRYVNPNAVLVVTAVPPKEDKQEEESGNKRSTGGYLVLYLIDGITGSVLSSMVQPNALPPVNVVALENQFMYHFFNSKRGKYQLSVWELFHDTDLHRGLTADSVTNARFVVQSITGSKADSSFSSYEVAPPQVIPVAFSFPTAVRSMGTTVSGKGVASKQLLVSLATDEIVSIDIAKHLEANSQQSVSSTSWLPTQIVSYNNTVIGADYIKTFPSKLESTCLMITYGYDIFFHRVTAGKPFDMLNEDFAYIPLFLTCVGVATLTVVVAILQKRKTLQGQWQ
eukprot:TRINITY_DN137_c13_g1_i1.p1 TRINITY_DN137_c13_g1~~TRINITY_DN137_c13_g1_i1.p1  ORF type:complete len:842 (+),score=172.14 TRINITY_DN137_c13_g1_i1:38-2563(+)